MMAMLPLLKFTSKERAMSMLIYFAFLNPPMENSLFLKLYLYIRKAGWMWLKQAIDQILYLPSEKDQKLHCLRTCKTEVISPNTPPWHLYLRKLSLFCLYRYKLLRRALNLTYFLSQPHATQNFPHSIYVLHWRENQSSLDTIVYYIFS